VTMKAADFGDVTPCSLVKVPTFLRQLLLPSSRYTPMVGCHKVIRT